MATGLSLTEGTYVVLTAGAAGTGAAGMDTNGMYFSALSQPVEDEVLPSSALTCDVIWQIVSIPKVSDMSMSPPSPFALQNHKSKLYLSAVFPTQVDPAAGPNMSSCFTAGSGSSLDAAMLCWVAAGSAWPDTSLGNNVLLVAISSDGSTAPPHPDVAMGLCQTSAEDATRMYAHPQICDPSAANTNGVPVCPLSWQACNPGTGYCFDAALLQPPSSQTGGHPIPTPNPVHQPHNQTYPFPNCTNRLMLRIAAMPTSLASSCKPAPIHPGKADGGKKGKTNASTAPQSLSKTFSAWFDKHKWLVGIVMVIVAVFLALAWRNYQETSQRLQTITDQVVATRQQRLLALLRQ